MPELSGRTENFTDSVIRRMTRVSLQYGAVNLSQGFPDFDPPQEILDRLAEVAYEDYHQYSITWGAQNFREALAEKLEAIGNMLGKYPHAAISLESKPKVQKTYMLKFVSPEEPDFFVRMTKGKYEEYGAPRDPWGNEMEQEQ